MTKNLLTLTRAEIEDMPYVSALDTSISNLAQRRAQQIDDLIMPLLKPWQRQVVLSPNVDKWYMRPLVRLVKRTAGIVVEHHQHPIIPTDDPNDIRIQSRIVIKQHGKIVKAEN